MKKTVKILLTVLVVFLVLNYFKNSIVGSAVEAGLSSATHVPVHIGSTRAGFLSGSIELRNIRVSNPASFPEKTMLEAPEVGVAFDPWALRQNQAHFKEVRVNIKELTVIKNRHGGLNIDAVRPKGQQGEKAETSKKETPMSLKIDALRLTIGRVVYKDYSAGGAPAVQTFEINIQDRVYQNIDNPTALVSLIMLEAIKNTTLSRLINLDLGAYKDAAQGILSGGFGLATGKGSAIVDSGSEAVGDAAKNILNLFK